MIKIIDNLSAETAFNLLPFFSENCCDAYVVFSLLDWTSVDAAWVQTQGDEISALIVQKELSKLYVTANDNSDYYELADFISRLGGMVVHCPCGITSRLGVTAFSKLGLMVLNKDIESSKKAVNINDNLKQAFDLLTQSSKNILKKGIENKDLKKYTQRAYKEWLSKTSRGIFNGYTSVMGIKLSDKSLLSVAIADKLAGMIYIRDVATDSDYRKMGYATDCIRALCNNFREDNEVVFLACDDIRTENFYKKIGFERKDYLELGIVEL